jgi:hypothetical protein
MIEYSDTYMDQLVSRIDAATRIVSACSARWPRLVERVKRSGRLLRNVMRRRFVDPLMKRRSSGAWTMSDKQPMQASGGGAKGAPDGVSDVETHGRSDGESQGGAYPNPHPTGKRRSSPGDFMGHGGQSHINYEGGDNPNATTRDED